MGRAQGNIYYQPQQFGMQIIGEIDRDGRNDFDKTVVWKLYDGSLMWASDRGCSCPDPFDNYLPTNLQPINTLEAHLRTHNCGDLTSADVALLEKVWSHS